MLNYIKFKAVPYAKFIICTASSIDVYMCELWIHRTHSTIDHADLSIVHALHVNGKLAGTVVVARAGQEYFVLKYICT